MNKTKIISILMLIALIALPSCSDNDKQVTVKVSKLSQSEVNILFEGRGRHLSKGKDVLIPLRVIVENGGNQAVTVKPATMAVTDSQVIYKKVEKNVAGIAAGASIGGFLLAGPIGAAAFGSGFGIANARKNEEILNQISEEAFVEPKEVYPHSSLNRIMFVRKNKFQSVFSMPVGSRMVEVKLA